MSTKFDTLPLPIELVPEALWGKSLASTLPRKEWDSLRKKVYARQEYTCGACRNKDVTLYCHEKWHYNDEKHTQTLIGFIALCGMCNNATHMGRSQILARQGKLDIEQVFRHSMKVNELSEAEFKIYHRLSFTKWRERTAWKEWETIIGDYMALVSVCYRCKAILPVEYYEEINELFIGVGPLVHLEDGNIGRTCQACFNNDVTNDVNEYTEHAMNKDD